MIGAGNKLWSISIDTFMLHTRLIKFKTWGSVFQYDAPFLNTNLQTKLMTHLPSWKESESPIHQESTPSRPEARSASWVWQHKCFCQIHFQIKLKSTRVSDFASVFGSTRKPPIESHSFSASAHESACNTQYVYIYLSYSTTLEHLFIYVCSCFYMKWLQALQKGGVMTLARLTSGPWYKGNTKLN